MYVYIYFFFLSWLLFIDFSQFSCYSQASLEHECQEARQRTEEEDQETVAKIIQHIRFLMKEILKLKTEKPDQVRFNQLLLGIDLFSSQIYWLWTDVTGAEEWNFELDANCFVLYTMACFLCLFIFVYYYCYLFQWSSEVEERRVQVLMLILSLRRLSRVQKVYWQLCVC